MIHALDVVVLCNRLAGLGYPTLPVVSRAANRREYLMRPDLGRELVPDSADRLASQAGEFDLAIVVADGLSALAVERHAPPLIAALMARLGVGWRLAPLVVAEQSRVALGDKVCRHLGAAGVLVLIGERPGLSSPDSLGAYLTWQPGPQTTDAARNCVSNIHLEGMDFDEAAHRLAYLLTGRPYA